MNNLVLDTHGESLTSGANTTSPKRDKGLPAGVSPALYNHDLAPTSKEGRTWGSYSLFTLGPTMYTASATTRLPSVFSRLGWEDTRF